MDGWLHTCSLFRPLEQGFWALGVPWVREYGITLASGEHCRVDRVAFFPDGLLLLEAEVEPGREARDVEKFLAARPRARELWIVAKDGRVAARLTRGLVERFGVIPSGVFVFTVGQARKRVARAQTLLSAVWGEWTKRQEGKNGRATRSPSTSSGGRRGIAAGRTERRVTR